MKKQVLMVLVLFALIGTGAAFAQQATMDKLRFTADNRNNPTYYWVDAANKQISGAVVIPGAYEGKTVRVSNRAFQNCANITSVVILNGVTQIDNRAFEGCTGLTSATIPNGVTSIENYTFNGCTSLANVTIPNSVTNIGTGAFAGTSLASVTIPASVTTIGGGGGGPFMNCTNLTSVTILASIRNLNANIPGDFNTKYNAASGGPGTYTRPAGSNTWTKQGTSQTICPTCGGTGYI